MYSYTVPANTLSTNKMLRLTFIGDYLNDSGVTRSVTVRIKYGATTIGSIAQGGLTTTPSRWGLLFTTEMSANNATNAQVARTNWSVTNAGDVTGVASGLLANRVSVHNAIAEDSTAAQNLVVTIQHDAAATTISAKAFTVQLELI